MRVAISCPLIACARCSHLSGSLDLETAMVFNCDTERCAGRHPRAGSETKDEQMSTGVSPNDSSEETLRMESIDRRRFLLQSGAAVAAAGVASAVPLTAANALNKGRGGTRHVDVPAGTTLDEPVVAHLRDLRTGEVSLFKGHHEVVVKDKHLAALLYHATR
jgi:hypothetical protein